MKLIKLFIVLSLFIVSNTVFAVCCNPGGQSIPAFNTQAKCKSPHVWIFGNSCNPPSGCCKSISGNNDQYCAQKIVGVPSADQYKVCIAEMQNCKWSCTMQSISY